MRLTSSKLVIAISLLLLLLLLLLLVNQSINQFNSGDVAHTRTRETDEQTENSRQEEQHNTKNILKTCRERLKRQTHKTQ